MNTFSGKGRIGYLAILTVLLIPLLGMSSANALDVGDKVWVSVPELSSIVTTGPTEHQFTCRAVSEHAYWLVQDTSCVASNGELIVPHSTNPDSICWDNIIDQDELDQLVADFEGGSPDIWNTVTGVFGTPVDVDSDPRIWIVLATIPTKYQPAFAGSSPTPRNNMYWVDVEQYADTAEDPHDMFYLNIGALASAPGYLNIARQLRPWNLAVGLAAMSSFSQQPEQEAWLVKGMSEVAQNLCYGFTSTAPGARGQKALVSSFAAAPYLDLRNHTGGKELYDYVEIRGTGFMWFMYLKQRFGSEIISAINTSDYVGMEAVANAIDPSVPIEDAIITNVVPIYMDWLVAASANYIHSDMEDGAYQFDFLVGTSEEDFSIIGSPGLSKKFTEYPFEGWMPRPPGGDDPALPSGMIFMESPIFSSHFISFADAGAAQNVFFNGMYSDGSGSQGAINGKWAVRVVQIQNDEIISVDDVEMSDFYNGTFQIAGDYSIAAITNNNMNGAGGLRYYLSQNATVPALVASVHMNALNSQYMSVYCGLLDENTSEVVGFDWVGPRFEAEFGDSIQKLQMAPLYGGIYKGIFTAWTPGTYELNIAGYDSVGYSTGNTLTVVSGYADTDLTLDLEYASLFVAQGGVATGRMVVLAETSELGLAVESQTTLSVARDRMTGIVAGPVAVSDVNGVLSFASASNDVSVYRYTDTGWVKLESWRQNGRVSANIDCGGIYALGEGSGAFAPELPAQLVLGTNSPNPFTAQTAISFGLPTSGNVRLSIYDMSGRLVSSLLNEDLAAANHTVIWEGTDTAGNQVGAGVYFCRLESAGQVITQKMLKVQ